MKIVQSLREIEPNKEIFLAIGNYDGVHLGHKYVLEKLVKTSRSKDGISVVITFFPHPREVIAPSTLKLLCSYEEKRKNLTELEIDYLVELPFNRDFSTKSPEEFLREYIFCHQKISYILLGHDFSFGSEKSGGVENLRKYIKENNLEVSFDSCDSYAVDGKVISSTEIRNHLDKGRVEEASKLIGRNFSLSGIVIKGDGRGKKIGFPTANIKFKNNRMIPLNGVYVSKVKYENMIYHSITNIGTKPTFKDSKERIVETNIFDFNEDIYGENLEVLFMSFIREENKYSSVNELINQIQQDVHQAKSYFNEKL